MVWTLPAGKTLGEPERSAIDQQADALDALLLQTPLASADWEAATLVHVTTMLKALPSLKQDATGYEAKGEAYLAALDDIPSWAVEEAIRLWYRGECGDGYIYRWAPSPADLRAIALREVYRVRGRIRQLRKLAAAVEKVEFSDEHRAEMRAKVRAVLAGKTSPAKESQL